jgi:hypothetical protein
MMWNWNETIWDQVNFSIFDNLNIVKNYHVFSWPNSSCYISANLYGTFIEIFGDQTSIIFFHCAKFHDARFKNFDMGSSQFFDFWQSENCEKLTCILVSKFKLLISANLYVTFKDLLGHQTSIIVFHDTKFNDVKFKRFDMGSCQLFDFWPSEYCEKLTCIHVTKFKLLYLRYFLRHLPQTFSPSNQYHPLS